MKIERGIALSVVGAAIFAFALHHEASASAPQSGLTPTGVYYGSCATITEGVVEFGRVILYGLGNMQNCENGDPTQFQPLPITSQQVLSNLAVASEEVQNSQTVPSTITLYVDGAPTALSCTVSQNALNCHDNVHKIAVGPGNRFSVQATCSTTGSSNCAQGLQVTIDRLQHIE